MRLIYLLGFTFVFLFLVACNSNEEKRIEGKWQLRFYELDDGSIETVDSIFYNFQKESFSAICLLNNGQYETFFGNYTLKGNKIAINLLTEYEGIVYNRFFGWSNWQREFTIAKLNSTTMQLNYQGDIANFRKY